MHPHERRHILRLAAAFAVLLAAGPAGADIWGYVDENGVAHLSPVPLDQRYFLFKKDYRPGVLPGAGGTLMPVPVPVPRRTTHVNPLQRKQFAPLVAAVAKAHALDPALLHAVITVESGYNPRAVSPKGARGLMQLMPETAERYAVRDIWDPRQNLDGGARYLRDLLGLFNDNLGLALAAYNAGEAAVIEAGNRIPPFPETRSYVPRVLQHYYLYRAAAR